MCLFSNPSFANRCKLLSRLFDQRQMQRSSFWWALEILFHRNPRWISLTLWAGSAGRKKVRTDGSFQLWSHSNIHKSGDKQALKMQCTCNSWPKLAPKERKGIRGEVGQALGWGYISWNWWLSHCGCPSQFSHDETKILRLLRNKPRMGCSFCWVR